MILSLLLLPARGSTRFWGDQHDVEPSEVLYVREVDRKDKDTHVEEAFQVGLRNSLESMPASFPVQERHDNNTSCS